MMQLTKRIKVFTSLAQSVKLETGNRTNSGDEFDRVLCPHKSDRFRQLNTQGRCSTYKSARLEEFLTGDGHISI